MKIRIVGTTINGNANIGDAKADQIITLFLLGEGYQTFVDEQEKLNTLAELLKTHVIDKAKRQLRLQRVAEQEAAFTVETNGFN